MSMEPDPGGFRIESLLAHREWVDRAARALVHGDADAEDLAQQAWLEILERPPARAPRSPRAWLRTVLRFKAVDRLRESRARRLREERVARPERTDAAPSDVVLRAELIERILRTVQDLEEPFRTAVLMRYVDALEPAEIAARTGTAVATVRTRIHRGLERVRGRLDAEEKGGRAAWAGILLPLTGGAGPDREPGTEGSGAPIPRATDRTSPGGVPGGVPGGLAMAVKTKAVAAVAVVAVLLGGFLLLRGGGSGSEASIHGTQAAGRKEGTGTKAGNPSPPPATADVAAGTVSDSPPPEPADRARGVLRGVVLATGRSESLAGVVVRARSSGGVVPAGMEAPPSPFRERTGETDAEGRFTLEGVPEGAWEVEATHPVHGAGRAIGIAGSAPPWMRLVLRESGTLDDALRLRIVDAAGLPREGVPVEVVHGRGAPISSGKTDGEGRVELRILREGFHLITVGSGGESFLALAGFITSKIHVRMLAEQDGPVQEVRPGGEAVLTLRTAGSLSGRVIAPGGELVAGAVVRAWALTFPGHGMGTSAISREASVGADGVYHFPSLPAGPYTLLVDHPAGLRVVSRVAQDDTPWGKGPPYLELPRVEVASGGETVRDLDVEPGASLLGSVEREDGSPVGGARVEIHLPLGPYDYPEQVKRAGVPHWRLDAAPWTDELRHPASFLVLHTDARGRYEARGLAPGATWRVRVVGGSGLSFDLRDPVPLEAGRTVELVHRVVGAGTLEALLPPFTSFALRRTGETQARASFVTPGGHGSVRIPNLPAGEWEILQVNTVTEEVLIPVGVFSIREGETTLLDLPGAGLTRVTLRFRAAGHPLAGVEVGLIHGRGLHFSGPDGTVEVEEHVAGGHYRSPDRDAMNLWFRAPGEDATRLSWRAPVDDAGAEGRREAVVDVPTGGLLFRAADPTGRPLAGVRVQPFRRYPGAPGPQDMQPEYFVRETGRDGRLLAAHLPDGLYQWNADFPDGSRRAGEAVVEGGEISDVELIAEVTGSLRVTVLQPDGRPAVEARVQVTVLRERDDPGEGAENRWGKAIGLQVVGVAGKDGVLVVTGVPTGRVRVTALARGTPTLGMSGDRAGEPVESAVVAPGETPVTVRLSELR